MRPTALPTIAAAILFTLALACGGGGGSGGAAGGGSGGGGGTGDGGTGGGGSGGSGGDGLPAIERLEPDHGTIGTRVIIHGRHFAHPASANQVFFNGQSSTALSVDQEGTQITTAVPLNATTGPVKLMVDGVNVDGPTFTVDPYPAPHLTDVSPDRVAVGEDATVVLTGTDFRPTARVVLDGTPISGTYVSSTRIELHLGGSSLARELTHTVKVVVDPPGGGTSEELTFEAVPRFALQGAAATSATIVDVRFAEALVAADAAVVTHYAFDPVLRVRTAAVDATDRRIVHLETDPQEVGVRYELSVPADLLSEEGHLSAPGTVSFLAFGSPPEHVVALGASGCDGFAVSGPGAITRSPNGFYLVERTGHQVQILDDFGAGRGYLGHNGTDARRHDGTGDDAAGCPGETGSTEAGAFRLPRGAVVRLNNGDLLVGDTGNGRVQHWTSGGAYLRTFGNLTAPVVLGKLGARIAVANSDDRIHLYSESGLLQDTVGGTGDTRGAFRFGIADGETPSMANLPTGNTAFVTDPLNHRVVRIVDGVPTGFLGGGVAGFRSDGSCCTAGTGAAAFDRPQAVAVGDGNRLFVIDRANGGRIQRFSVDGEPEYETNLGFLPGGLALGHNDLGEFWLISEPAGDKVHLFQP